MENWIRTEFPIFLESNNDVSNNDFLAVHKKFLIEITVRLLFISGKKAKFQTREHGIISIVANINKIPSSESQKFILIQQQFESLKKSFERRIQLGTLFENVKFYYIFLKAFSQYTFQYSFFNIDHEIG